MSNETDHVSAVVSKGVSKEIARHQARKPEGYSRSKAIEDLLTAGAHAMNPPPKWVRPLTSLAHFAAIATMVSGLFLVAGFSTAPVIAFFVASTSVMFVSGGARVLFERRRSFR